MVTSYSFPIPESALKNEPHRTICVLRANRANIWSMQRHTQSHRAATRWIYAVRTTVFGNCRFTHTHTHTMTTTATTTVEEKVPQNGRWAMYGTHLSRVLCSLGRESCIFVCKVVCGCFISKCWLSMGAWHSTSVVDIHTSI